MSEINVSKLTSELMVALIPIDGVADVDGTKANLRIDFKPEATQQNITDAQLIVVAHSPSTPANDYLKAHANQLMVFARALKALEDGIDAHTTPGANQLVDLQTALTAAMTHIGTLPAAFQNHLSKLRDLSGVTTAIGSMTLAEARNFQAIFRGWLNSRLIAGLFSVNE